jgi:RNA polymerase sigma-70 factor (ECF subfamily)
MDAILNEVKKLPEGARMVFNLFAIEGYSHKEIALKMDISESTSKSQYARAKSLLSSWLKTEYHG